MPTVELAVILSLGDRSETIPVFDRGLLVDAIVAMLHDLVGEARCELDPEIKAVRAEEAIVLARVMQRMVPEIRELLRQDEPTPALVVQ